MEKKHPFLLGLKIEKKDSFLIFAIVLSFSLLFSTTTDKTKIKVLNRVYRTKKPIFVPAEEVSTTYI